MTGVRKFIENTKKAYKLRIENILRFPLCNMGAKMLRYANLELQLNFAKPNNIDN